MRQGILIIIFCLMVAMVLVIPVQADLIAPAITHVYFEKNETPYHNPVHYSVKCYGYRISYPPVTRAVGSYQQELVFSYSATCLDYGCVIYEPYYYKAHIDRCDLEGITLGIPFQIYNFSLKPYTQCSWIPDRTYRAPGLWNEQYFMTPEFQLCGDYRRNQSGRAEHRTFVSCDPFTQSGCVHMIQDMTPIRQVGNTTAVTVNLSANHTDLQQYIHYLETCDPRKDPSCGGWVINGEPLKGMHQYRPFLENATHIKDHPCDTFLVKVDPGLIIPMTEDKIPYRYGCVGPCNQTEAVCESRFTIPPGNLNATSSGNLSSVQQKIPLAAAIAQNLTTASQSTPPAVHRSPVESLYCDVLWFFGATC